MQRLEWKIKWGARERESCGGEGVKKNISNMSESEWNATVPTLAACARWFMEKRERKTDDASRRDGKKQKQRDGKKGGMHAKWYSAYQEEKQGGGDGGSKTALPSATKEG